MERQPCGVGCSFADDAGYQHATAGLESVHGELPCKERVCPKGGLEGLQFFAAKKTDSMRASRGMRCMHGTISGTRYSETYSMRDTLPACWERIPH